MKVSTFVHPKTSDQLFAGITTRDYFAAMAFQGIAAGKLASKQDFDGWEDIAAMAVMAADELIRELGKETQTSGPKF